jgi:hypothetical protein
MYILRASKKIFIVMFLGLLSGTGCSLQKTQATSSAQPETQTVGWIEKGKIAGVDEEIKFRLDTGASTTSI